MCPAFPIREEVFYSRRIVYPCTCLHSKCFPIHTVPTPLSDLTSFYVVESIGNEVEILKEIVSVYIYIKDKRNDKLFIHWAFILTFRFRANSIFVRRNANIGIHLLDRFRGGRRFRLLHVPRSKEKLSIQIRLFNLIHVGDDDFAAVATGNAHHGEIFQEFAANRSRANLGK